jgi:hypothetical protein
MSSGKLGIHRNVSGRWIFASLCAVTMGFGRFNLAHADVGLQPRLLGMGGARAATACGAEAIFANPANLALPGGKTFEFHLLGLGLFVYNSSLSLHFYNRFNGDSLDEHEKQEVLSYFPDDGWKIGFLSEVPAFALRVGRFGLAVQVGADGAIALPKELVRRPLYGLGMHQTYPLEPFSGEAVGFAKAELAYAQPFEVSFFDRFAVGIGLSYLQGLGHAEILEAKGYFTNDFNAALDWRVRARTATLGSGFGLDLGAGATRGALRFGLAVSPVVGRIAWKQDTKEYFFWIHGDSLNVTRLDTLDSDEVFQKQDSSYAVGSFATSLPSQLLAGVSYHWKKLEVALDFHQYFQERYGHSTTPEFALGLESRYIPFLPMRLGVALGGGRKIRPSCGFGIYLPGLRWDFAIGGSGSFIPSRWNGLALGTALRLAL